MQVQEKRIGKFLVVKPIDRRIDFKNGVHFKDKMAELIEGGNMFILLDLSEVEFIDSSGLGAVVSSLKRMKGRGDLYICGLRETIMTMFNLTRMDRVFRIFASEHEAINTLSNP
jgi:anti-sigma B factor antagonist